MSTLCSRMDYLRVLRLWDSVKVKSLQLNLSAPNLFHICLKPTHPHQFRWQFSGKPSLTSPGEVLNVCFPPKEKGRDHTNRIPGTSTEPGTLLP